MPLTTNPFLALPREIRDEIYTYAIQHDWEPHFPPPHAVDKSPSSEDTKWRPIDLLLVNHQVHAELQDLLPLLQPTSHSLSIKIYGNSYVPVWTHFNYALRPRSHLNLSVNLIIAATDMFQKLDPAATQPRRIYGSLLDDLARFLTLGPSWLVHDPPYQTPGPHFIELLHVHVTFQDDYTPDTWPETVHEMFRRLKALSTMTNAPKYIGRIRASTVYEHRGVVVRRQSEWKPSENVVPTKEHDEICERMVFFSCYLWRPADDGESEE